MKVFHRRLFKPLGLAVFIGASLILNTSCSKKSSTTSSTPTPTPAQAAPIVSLIEPGATYSQEIDSVTISGTVTDTDNVGVSSLTVNSVAVDVTTLTTDTFTVKLEVTADTMLVIALLTAKNDSVSSDTITVYRTPSGIAAGMSMISGTLLKESSSRDDQTLAVNMVARNAEGREKMVRSVVPISGADIMLYNANSVSTSSDTSITTDSAGGWSVSMAPGNYFVFAVYFDRTNLEIVTAGLPNIEAIVDKETKTDSATAISDDVKPMLLTFLDASEANNNNMFLASDVPENLPIVMTFSEVMTRVSAGDSISGVVLGKTDPDSSDLPMLDTIPVKKLWGPNGKELRLKPSAALTVGATYKVIIPNTIKDLALNKLDNTYYGLFTVISAVSLPDFAVSNSSPKSGDTITAGFPVEIIFTRPIDMISLNKKFSITPPSRQDDFKGYFEGKGKIARFVNISNWAYSSPYTITLDAGTKDLLGDSLGAEFKLTFHIAAQDTFEQKEGVEGQVAAAINKFLGAYIAGDIEAFGKAFHNKFEMIDVRDDGSEERLQRDKFLEERRDDIEQQNRYSKIGFLAPKFYYPEIGGERYVCWKLVGDSTVYFEDLGPSGGFNKVPKVFNSAKTLDISSFVQYIDRGLIYGDDTLIFAPDWSKGFIDEDSRENDEGFFGRLLKDQTDVETQSILLETKTTFFIKSIKNDTSAVNKVNAMIKLITERKFKDGLRPYPIHDPQNPPPDIEKHVMALQTQLIQENGKWYVIQMIAKELFSGDMQKFHADSVKADDFAIKHFEHTKPIELVKPTNKGTGITAPVTLEWSVPSVRGNIGGYLVGISNEMSGGNQGLIMYTNQTKIVIDSNGTVDSNTTILNLDPMSLHLPLPPFSSRLTSFKVSDSAIYVWKVAAISDTVASDVSNNRFHVIADSDFGPSMGPGFFTMLDEMPDFQNMVHHQPPHHGPADDHFMDSDGDQFPDYFERAFKTDPFDPGSFPDFRIDTDLDGYADFIEGLGGSDPDDKTSVPTDANSNKIPDDLEDNIKNPDWRPHLAMDDDNDGFPTEYEFIFGSDPWNPNSKPDKLIKPMAPEGTYFAGIRFGDGPDGKVEKLFMRISSDTTGDFVNVDSTHIKGLAKGGTGLNLKLYFRFGEFVFYLPIVDGMNTGKFIKVRFMSRSTAEGMILEGPVDMADMEPGGGPYIGHFAASTDTSFDPSSWFSGGGPGPVGPGPGPGPGPDGELHLPPPPPDLMEQLGSLPDSTKFEMLLTLTYDDSNYPAVATVVIDGDTMVDNHVFWGPGNWPALGFNWSDSDPAADDFRHLDGNLHRIMVADTPNPTIDTLVLTGFYNKDKPNANEHEHFEFVLKLGGFEDPRKPVGTWEGWYFKKQMDPQMGPLPFIGTAQAVQAALIATDSNAVIKSPEGPTGPVKIINAQKMGNIWEAKVVGKDLWYNIMEKPGDWEKVLIKEVNDSLKVIILEPTSGQHQGPPPPFNGDSMVVVNALIQSNNTVVEFTPNGPKEITVDPATLTSTFDRNDPSNKGWAILEVGVDVNKPPYMFIFMADHMNPDRLQLENGIPAVFRHDLQPPPPAQP